MQLTKYDTSRKPAAISPIYGKVPPQAKELEEAVLGAILLEKNAFENANEVLAAECFYSDAHQHIYEAMEMLAARNQPIDLLTLVEQLKSNGKLDIVGGPFYVTKLTNAVVSAANINAHSRIIMQKYLLRELIRISGEVLNAAYDEENDVFEVMDHAEESMSSLRSNNIRQSYKSISQVTRESLKRMEELRMREEEVTGVDTGFDNLNMVTSGWQQPDLIILAARPSVGKTAFALTLAKKAARGIKKTPVGFFSLEMSDRQLVDRMLSQETGLWLLRMRNGKVDDAQMKRLYEGADQLDKCPIYLDDTAGISIQEFRTKARQMKRKQDVGLIIVDYLQLMTVANFKGSREQVISNISSNLKACAKELQIPIIALSQLSRDIEKTGGKDGKREPMLSDLRESGAIEQDADMVMFMWKPSEVETDQDAGLKDNFFLKIAKYRNGDLEKFIGKFTGADQTHHYLKVVDNKTLVPSEGNWKAVKDVVDYSAPRSDQSFVIDEPAADDMPF